MTTAESSQATLSPWWRHGALLVMVCGFTVLLWVSLRTYEDAPPIPERVMTGTGVTLFSRSDILEGQQVFLKYGLMDNGTIWGHGAYLGPDFSAAYLHALVVDATDTIAEMRYGADHRALSETQREAVRSAVREELRKNRYDPVSGDLQFTPSESASYRKQVGIWANYFAEPGVDGGLPKRYISDPHELHCLVAFFAWTAWASVTLRPGEPYSYTSNFPYDPDAGNTPTADAYLWSGLSLVALLGGVGLILAIFGKFNYLGWKGKEGHVHPQMLPGVTTDGQNATIKYFALAAILFLVQTLVGGATAHYRADPTSFYGIDVARFLPSTVARTWHLQLAIFWVATAYVAGGLFLASSLGKEPNGLVKWINLLFGALALVVIGSLIGEYLGINQLLGRLWFWLGNQGWEYLELGRVWQMLLSLGLVLWLVMIFRTLGAARMEPDRRELASLFLYSAIAIPLFYLPAMFFTSTTHFSVVDIWRFWIIHLWVEGFFEVFVTVMVATLFSRLGIITAQSAARVVYLDAILYLGGGIVGTGHHWYWSGQPSITMALGAMFSALEVVPLTLLTLDAWDFVKLTRGTCDICGKRVSVPHKWTFYFLMSVGFWNFVGAGVFGFLINLPVISFFEVGTILTPNHGHAAMMGVFGMLALALITFALRQVATEDEWSRREKFVKLSFWGVNIGLALMIITNLFPGGILQLLDVLQHGYWHARSTEFLGQGSVRLVEWLRLPGDLIFILLGAVPMLIAACLTYRGVRSSSGAPGSPASPGPS